MRSTLISAVVLGLGALAGGMAASPSTADGPEWSKDFNAARQTARRTNRPIFAVIRCER